MHLDYIPYKMQSISTMSILLYFYEVVCKKMAGIFRACQIHLARIVA